MCKGTNNPPVHQTFGQLFLINQRIKFLFELGQIFVVKPIEMMDTALFVEKAIGWIACQSNILLNSVLLVVRQVIVNTIEFGEVILCDDVFP